jgi:hypothetical protein
MDKESDHRDEEQRRYPLLERKSLRNWEHSPEMQAWLDDFVRAAQRQEATHA